MNENASLLKHTPKLNAVAVQIGENMQLLSHLEWYSTHYFKSGEISTVETGCGVSSVLLTNRSTNHTIYVEDDRGTANSAVERVNLLISELKISSRPRWVFGAGFKTIITEPPVSDVDLVLINGRHFYPAPDLEVFSLCKHLKENGLLMVGSTQVPTVANLCKFLLQEPDFRTLHIHAEFAVFQRLRRSEKSNLTDYWWEQKYNIRNYDVSASEKIDSGLHLPVRYEFGRNQNETLPIRLRGFAMRGGRWFSDGYDSSISLKLDVAPMTAIRVTLEIEPIAYDERIEAGQTPNVKILESMREVNTFEIPHGKRQLVSFDINGFEPSNLELEMWHGGTISASQLHSFEKLGEFDTRRPNFFLNALEIVKIGDSKLEIVKLCRTDGSIFSFTHQQKSFSFFVNQIHDSVQNFHVNGRFYELGELEIIRSFVKPQSRILEVGAHVGNHTIFFHAFLQPKTIVVVEPNPRTQEILRINVALNSADTVDQTRMNYALGARNSIGHIEIEKKYNSGGSALEPKVDGNIQIVSGDDLFADERFDFVKIDVEGMELEVLAGMTKSIKKHKPIMFVEVSDPNLGLFNQFLHDHSYEICWQDKMYPLITNFIVRHKKLK